MRSTVWFAVLIRFRLQFTCKFYSQLECRLNLGLITFIKNKIILTNWISGWIYFVSAGCQWLTYFRCDRVYHLKSEHLHMNYTFDRSQSTQCLLLDLSVVKAHLCWRDLNLNVFPFITSPPFHLLHKTFPPRFLPRFHAQTAKRRKILNKRLQRKLFYDFVSSERNHSAAEFHGNCRIKVWSSWLCLVELYTLLIHRTSFSVWNSPKHEKRSPNSLSMQKI